MTIYQDTLRSARWRELKWRRIMYSEFRCEGCGRFFAGRSVRSAMRVFELHHRHYRTVGHEELDDVMVLCPICHALEHKKIPEAR